MTRLNTLIEAFITTNSLANAKALVAHVNRNQAELDFLTEDHAGQVRCAERIVADAKDPKKLREAMQTELRARFKGMKIHVI